MSRFIRITEKGGNGMVLNAKYITKVVDGRDGPVVSFRENGALREIVAKERFRKISRQLTSVEYVVSTEEAEAEMLDEEGEE